MRAQALYDHQGLLEYFALRLARDAFKEIFVVAHEEGQQGEIFRRQVGDPLCGRFGMFDASFSSRQAENGRYGKLHTGVLRLAALLKHFIRSEAFPYLLQGRVIAAFEAEVEDAELPV